MMQYITKAWLINLKIFFNTCEDLFRLPGQPDVVVRLAALAVCVADVGKLPLADTVVVAKVAQVIEIWNAMRHWVYTTWL